MCDKSLFTIPFESGHRDWAIHTGAISVKHPDAISQKDNTTKMKTMVISQ